MHQVHADVVYIMLEKKRKSFVKYLNKYYRAIPNLSIDVDSLCYIALRQEKAKFKYGIGVLWKHCKRYIYKQLQLEKRISTGTCTATLDYKQANYNHL